MRETVSRHTTFLDSTSMPKLNFRRGLLLAATFAFLLSILPAPTEAATLNNNNWPKSFTIQYCWGATDPSQVESYCPYAELTLHRRPKKFDVFDFGSGRSMQDAGNWRKTRRWATVEFELYNGVIYSGTRLPDGTFEGFIMSPSGIFGAWKGTLN